MVSITPFRALRPSDDPVTRTVDGALRAAERAARRAQHPRHTAWLEAWDDETPPPVATWLEEGALVEDDRPLLRVVSHLLPGGHEVVGVLGAVRLADLVPHEQTDAGAVRRRVQRDRLQEVDSRPLLAVLPTDPPGVMAVLDRLRAGRPETDVYDETGVRHRVWVCDEETTATLRRALDPLPCLLADGHHRAAAASTAGRAEAMALVTFASAAPRLLPVWRIGAIPPGNEEAVRSWIATLPPGDDVEVHYGGIRRSVGGDGVELPVETSQRLAEAAPGIARVTTTADPTATAVAATDGALVVAATPPTVTDVLSAIAAGRPLPPKSTAFTPKPRVGLTMVRL